jgi:hypothetical protein
LDRKRRRKEWALPDGLVAHPGAQYNPILDPLFVPRFNAKLEQPGSEARIAITNASSSGDVFELCDDEGLFVTLLPTSPRLKSLQWPTGFMVRV